jgi:hypothetical protein
MKRVAMILAVLGILVAASSQVQAHDHHYSAKPHHGQYYSRYCGPSVVYPPVVYGPGAFVGGPRLLPIQSYSRPVYYYPRYYAPVPRYGFYYQNRGLSLGIGF